MDLVADPAAVIKTFVPNALQMELCYVLAGSAAELSVLPNLVPSFDERMGKNPSSNIPAEHSAPPDSTDLDSGTEALPSIQEIVYSQNPALSEPAETVPANSEWCDLVHLHGLPC
jgi:hypothetical protein